MRRRSYHIRAVSNGKALVFACLALVACSASRSHLASRPSTALRSVPSTTSSVPPPQPAVEGAAVSPAGGVAGAIAQLALGSSHSCALAASGSVWCWGQNDAGQLGDGALRDSWRPSQVRGLVDAVEIQASTNTTCARSRSGEVSCWGSNYSGQVGQTPSSCSPVPKNVERECPQPVPKRVPEVSGALAITVGLQHACALLKDGTVSCWGDNTHGELSLASPHTTFQRARVSGLPKAIAIAAAGLHTCAITEDKRVWCWGGYNEGGVLGTADMSPTLRRVPGVSAASRLESDTGRVCARVPAGFDCWGDRRPCPTGDLAGPPARFKFSSKVSQVARATDACASCVLLQTAQVKCTFMQASGLTPEREVLPGAETLAAGGGHFCALLPSGNVACWGANYSGQIGQPPSDSEIHEPQQINWNDEE